MKITNVHVKRLTGLPRLLGTASVVFDDCFKVCSVLQVSVKQLIGYILA